MALSRSRTKIWDMLIRLYIGVSPCGSVVLTRSILGSVRSPGFSETARSGPLHDEARGEGDHVLPVSILRRRHPHDVAKRAAEGAQAGEAGVEADVRHALTSLAQHEHGPLDPAPLKVPMGRLPEGRPKGPDEMCL